MSTSIEEYEHLKSKIINQMNHIGGDVLLSVKEIFEEVIDSKRIMENIKTPSELFTILEKRDYFLHKNPKQLSAIMKLLQSRSSPSMSIEHNFKDSVPYYSNCRTHVNNSDDMKNKEINDELIKRLGTFWTKFARQFEIQENEIDNIEKKYGDSIEDCIKAVLSRIQILYPNFQVRCKYVKKALESIRRNDLKDKIENILCS